MIRWPWKRSIKLASGSVVFSVPLEDGEQVDWKTDLITLRLTCLDVQSLFLDHDGNIRQCPEFFEMLSRRLNELGCPRSTPTLASQVWLAVDKHFLIMQSEFQKQIQKLR
jgi:hypothetical protein